MKIVILMVGKDKQRFITEATNEYLKRLQGYLNVETITVPSPNVGNKTNPGKIIKLESGAISDKLPDDCYSIILDQRGKQYSSRGFAKKFQKLLNYQSKPIYFIIGGAYGITKSVKREANQIISLSKMTFTHQMTRVILLEQIYRAMTIIKGKKYHH